MAAIVIDCHKPILIVATLFGAKNMSKGTNWVWGLV